MFNVQWPKINPGSNVTHVVVIRPLKEGNYNFTSAVVQYVASESSDPTVCCDVGLLKMTPEEENDSALFFLQYLENAGMRVIALQSIMVVSKSEELRLCYEATEIQDKTPGFAGQRLSR